MTCQFKYYIPSQPANITMYVIVNVSGMSMNDAQNIATEHVLETFPNAESDSMEVIDWTE